MKDFPRLVSQGYPNWKDALSKIKIHKESSVQLAILNKIGQPLLFECYMGIIAKGPFAQHVIGILRHVNNIVDSAPR